MFYVLAISSSGNTVVHGPTTEDKAELLWLYLKTICQTVLVGRQADVIDFNRRGF